MTRSNGNLPLLATVKHVQMTARDTSTTRPHFLSPGCCHIGHILMFLKVEEQFLEWRSSRWNISTTL